jgi:hypothetical protein
MSACGTYTGILFSRKPCGQAGVLSCGRCKTPVCKQHVRPQRTGPFLCPSCDAYSNDDDWGYSNNDNRWHYRDRSRSERIDPRAAAAGAVAGDLADEDKAGLSTNGAGAWHGPDDGSADESADGGGGDDADSPDNDTDDGGFDAS